MEVLGNLNFNHFTYDTRPFSQSSENQAILKQIVLDPSMKVRLKKALASSFPYVLGVIEDTNKHLHASDGVDLNNYLQTGCTLSPFYSSENSELQKYCSITRVFYYYYWPDSSPRKWYSGSQFQFLHGWSLEKVIDKNPYRQNIENYLSNHLKAEKGDRAAQYAIGEIFEGGLDGLVNFAPFDKPLQKLGMNWYIKAGIGGDVRAIRKVFEKLGSIPSYESPEICESIIKNMLNSLERLAREEDFEALRLLGEFYKGGRFLVSKQDFFRSLEYYKKAAGTDAAEAYSVCDLLAAYYYSKPGCEKEALYWSVKAIRKRDGSGTGEVEMMAIMLNICRKRLSTLEAGETLLKVGEYQLAIDFFNQAIEELSPEESSISKIEIHKTIAIAIRRRDLSRLGYVEQSARESLGSPLEGEWCYQFGMLFFSGKETPQDRPKALYWFEEAATLGNEDAKAVLRCILEEGIEETSKRKELTHPEERSKKKQKS